MNKLEIVSVEIENFLSFQTKQIVEFKNSGIHLITGENQDLQPDAFNDEIVQKNGVGKSAILRAIDFVFFGDSPNKKIKLDNLINKTSGKNTLVSIVFKIGEDQYRIERYIKHTNKYNSLHFFKWDGNNYEDISLSEKKTTQERIENIIRINHNTFLKSIFLTREGPRSFIELPWFERSQILESIVKLDKLKDYTKNVKDKLSKDRKELTEKLTLILSCNSSIASYKKIIKSDINNQREKRARDKIEIDTLKQELKLLLGGEYDTKLINDLTKVSHSYYESLKELQMMIDNKDEIIKKTNEIEWKLKQLDKETLQIAEKIIKINKDINDHLNSKDHLCQHCGKEPNNLHSKVIASLNERLLENKQLSEKLYSESLNFSIEKGLLEKKLELEDIKIKQKQYDNKVFDLPPLLKRGIVDAVVRKESFIEDKFFKDISEKIAKIVELKSKIFSLDNIREARKHLWFEKIDKKENEIIRKFLERRIEIGEFWDAALDFRNEGSLKNFIMAKIVPVFNSILDSMINIIFEGTLSIAFDNSWNENIIYNKHQFDYESLSLGEKTKINLCISLSLLSLLKINIGSTSCIFMDEVFSSIDAATIRKFISIFRASYQDMAIYIISHEFSDFTPDSYLKIIKKNGESLICTP